MDIKTLKALPPWEWPGGADRILLDILRDKKAKAGDRRAAAELAGDMVVINDELVDALLDILAGEDNPEELRACSAIALGPVLEQSDIEGFDDPEDAAISEETFRKIRETLRRLYRDDGVPKEVRRRILEASVRAAEDWHGDAIRAAYTSGEEDWKLTAVFCMREVKGFDKQILEALESENEDIHYQAVCAAGNWEIKKAWPHVLALVRSERTDKPLRVAAIHALADIRPEEAEYELAHLFNSDDEDIVDEVREALAIAGRIQDDDLDDL